jgi:lysine-ketoglutarate reductase/saccharopine dehydrogenase-like protein (TIGR00300 family)
MSEVVERGNGAFSEEVELRGHIIDSLILPKVLDEIIGQGGAFQFKDVKIGHARTDPSYARIEVSAGSAERLQEILRRIADHGASPIESRDATLAAADLDGAFPEGFYSTTNQRTEVRIGGKWVPVEDQEMDCGIVVDTAARRARCIAMCHVKRGEAIVVGHRGVRVFPLERERDSAEFEFMASAVSSEKPKAATVRRIGSEMKAAKAAGDRILLVAGPALVHTGSVEYVVRMIRDGHIHVLFAGNALAAHDIEYAMFGTSLGVYVDRGTAAEHGHEHHLRAINSIRRLGGIRQAVEAGVLKSGIMYECVRHNVAYVLAGSIRDDGPLPDVITDVLAAQDRMRAALAGVRFCLMIATTLHSIATGNLLPAWVRTVCVDINPATVTKLADRGTFQTIGVVTDVEPFLRALAQELGQS